MKKDIRWVQRFSNFNKAMAQLSKFIQKRDLNELELQGLIQSFEYNFELAWNTIKIFMNLRVKQIFSEAEMRSGSHSNVG